MFFEEYVDRVIRPKVDPIIEGGVSSMQDLTNRFNEAHGCRISTTRMREWIVVLGYRLSRRVTIERPGRAAPEPIQVHQDLQTKSPRFNVPAPPVGMFTNVPMPGFQE